MVFGKYAVDYEERINYDRLRRERLERAKAQLNKEGLGAVITWDAANVRYLTSYYVTTPTRAAEMTFVVLPRNGEPILFGAPTPAETARRMPWLEGRVKPGLRSMKMSNARTADAGEGFAVTIGRILAEHGVENETIGLDGTTAAMLYSEAFARKGIKTCYAKPTMADAREIKTQDEIALMRIACANSEKAFAAVADAIRPGIRECDLVAVGIKALYEEGVDHVEDLVCASGYNTNPFSYSFTDKPIQPGDLVYVDVNAAAYQGYMPCVYRTFCCGKASTEQKVIYEEARAMLYNGMSAIKAGATTHDVIAHWPDSPEYWGYTRWSEVFPLAVGHGIGLTLHELPNISPSDKTTGVAPVTFKEGMVLALETWTGKKGGKDGVRLEEDVVVTKDGYELLTRFPVNELIECWR